MESNKNKGKNKEIISDEKDWKEIHPDFTEELIKEWERKRFRSSDISGLGVDDYVGKWIKKGYHLSEANLASYCRYKGLEPWKKRLKS